MVRAVDHSVVVGRVGTGQENCAALLRFCDRGLVEWSELHLSKLQRVVVVMPGSPVDSVSVTGMWTAEVESVEVGRVASFVPPTAFE